MPENAANSEGKDCWDDEPVKADSPLAEGLTVPAEPRQSSGGRRGRGRGSGTNTGSKMKYSSGKVCFCSSYTDEVKPNSKWCRRHHKYDERAAAQVISKQQTHEIRLMLSVVPRVASTTTGEHGNNMFSM